MRDELYQEILMILMQEGFDTEGVKSKLIMTLNNYEVIERTTEIIPYEGGDIEKYIKMFLISKRIAGRTERTLDVYKKTLELFFREIPKNPTEVTADDIRLFLATKEIRDGVGKVYQKNLFLGLSSFYEWMTREEHVVKNPILKVESIKLPKVKKEAFTEMQVEMLRLGAEKDLRLTLILELLLSTWCRISELCIIKISEISNDMESVTVHGKGQKDRKCYINARAKLYLMKYLAERKDDNPYLFPCSICRKVGRNSGMVFPHEVKERGLKPYDWWKAPDLVGDAHVDKSTVGGNIRELGIRVGVEKTHPHRFRRTGATFALRKGMPIEKVSKLLGHESIETTQIYLDLSEDDLSLAHKKYV